MQLKDCLFGLAAATALAVAASGANAAVVPDLTFGAAGTYDIGADGLALSGTFEGALLGDPTIDRDYSLAIGFAVNGSDIFDESIPLAQLLGGAFSIQDAAFFVIDILDDAFGLANVIDFLDDHTSDVVFGPNSVEGKFDFLTDDGDIISVLAALACGEIFEAGDASDCELGTEGTFALDVALTYELAPIPLPAALPLLAVGLGGLGLVARRRARS